VPGTLLAAITGGTGKYQHARGQIVATDGADGLINVVIPLSTELSSGSTPPRFGAASAWSVQDAAPPQRLPT
jgi:hypothetical protein